MSAINAKSVLSANQTCSTKCRSKIHQILCFAALTQNVDDEELLKAFLLSTCQNFYRTFDDAGRTLVHWSASCGKISILEWLLNEFKSELNSKDAESGYTPLHRAFLYGQISCAQILLKHGASLNVLDQEFLTPVDILQKNSNVTHFSLSDPTEIYAAGENVCYNLGLAVPVRKLHYEPIEFFSRQSISIKQVAMSNYHTLFLVGDGRLFSCGHGSGGRLGHGDENAQIIPRLVERLPPCRFAAVSNNHSIVVTNDGDAYSWGDNAHKALGHGIPCEKELSPTQIILPKNFKGICNFVGCAASSTFSVLWSEDLVCTFGENNGQIGHSKNEPAVIVFPKQVSCIQTKNVDHVVCCESATAVVVRKGDIYLLQDYEAKKVVSRMLDLKSAHMTVSSDNRLRLFLLTTGGKLFQWRETDTDPRRTVFTGVPRLFYPAHLSVYNNGAFIVSPNGHAYLGKFASHTPAAIHPVKNSHAQTPTSPSSSKNGAKKLIAKDKETTEKSFAFRETGRFLDHAECYHVSLTQLPNVHRAVWSSSSPDGQNSFVVQQHSSAHLTDLPSVGSSEILKDYEHLLTDVDLDDGVSDIVISCGGRNFAAHRFVLASRSSYFARNMTSSVTQMVITSMDPLIFEQILKYIYSDDCEVLKVPWKGFEKYNPQKMPKGQKDPLSSVAQAAKQLGVDGLIKRLEVISWNSATLETKFDSRRKVFTPKFRLERHSFPELYDAWLVCSDGTEIGCHQCVLCSRVNYFKCMFSSAWMNTSRQSKHRFNADSATALNLLNFVYHDDLPSAKAQMDEDPLNPYCKLMIVADEWLLDRLRQMCEIKLCDLISLKNVCELLEFAQMCNADQLKKSCLQFACLNMPAIVESNALLQLSQTSLQSVDRYYRESHRSVVLARKIRPYSSVTSEDLEMAYVLLQSTGATIEECTLELLRQSAEVDASRQHKGGAKRKNQPRKISESATVPESQPINKSNAPNQSELKANLPTETHEKPWTPTNEHVKSLSVIQSDEAFVARRTITRPRNAPWLLDAGSPKSDEIFPLVSLKEVMLMEEKKSAEEIKMKPKSSPPTTIPSSVPKKIHVWQTPTPAGPISSSPDKATSPKSFTFVDHSESLSKIILDEEKGLLKRREVLNKPLKYIQCEELALQELLIAYDADYNFDELITVERYFVDPVAEPSWQAHCGSSP